MASIPDKMYISAVMVPEKRLKCACQGCDKTASPGNQVSGSFMPGPDLVSEIDLKYNRIASKVTLYLCDGCILHVTQVTPEYKLNYADIFALRDEMRKPMKPINPDELNKPEDNSQCGE